MEEYRQNRSKTPTKSMENHGCESHVAGNVMIKMIMTQYIINLLFVVKCEKKQLLHCQISDLMDFSSMSLHQTKKLEMQCQVSSDMNFTNISVLFIMLIAKLSATFTTAV